MSWKDVCRETNGPEACEEPCSLCQSVQPKFCGFTMYAIETLAKSVDGVHGISLHPSEGFKPKGVEQDCDAGVVSKEWVKQSGPGMAGDDFHGTVTWCLGSYYLVAEFAT